LLKNKKFLIVFGALVLGTFLLFETNLIVRADSVTLSGGTAANTADAVNCAADASNIWISPADSLTQNNVYADVTNSKFGTPDVTERLDNTNFGFAIPADATIDGIEVSVDRYMDAGGATDYFIKLFKAGTLVGNNKSTGAVWPASDTDTYVTYGGPTDLWGTTWTEADIENTNFGVALCAQATVVRTDVHVDHITITVYYTPLAVNNTPTISSATNNPDPVDSGNDVTFSVNWNDIDTEGIKMFICKSNSINTVGPACTTSSWCENSGSFSLTNPSQCNYSAQVGDEGSNNYYAFVCDDEISCSAGTAGTFTVNVPVVNVSPTVTTVIDSPDPVTTGNNTTFSVDWNDGNGEGVKMFICKSNSINTVGPACTTSSWCENSSSFSMTDPLDCLYTSQVADEGSNNYYAFVCDDEISCSSGSAGTFEVSATATPTPTPTPEPEEPAVVEVISGGGNSPARIIFNGEIFPGAVASLYLIGEEYGQVQIGDSFTVGSDGKFLIEAISPVEEERLYALLVNDPDGNVYKSKFFNYDLEFNTIVRQRDLIFAPTINLNKRGLIRNEILLVSGYGAPGNRIEFLIDNEVKRTVDVESNGLYRVDFDTLQTTLGNHSVKTRQYDPETGKTSDSSDAKFIKVSLFGFSNVDFNQDSKIDISDWSIFLHFWFDTNEEERQKADLSGDGKVGIEDFSLFLQSFQLGN